MELSSLSSWIHGPGHLVPVDSRPRSEHCQRYEAITIWSHLNSNGQRDDAQKQGYKVPHHKWEIFFKHTENLGSFSTLLVSFHLQRHMGDFVIQVRGLSQPFINFWLSVYKVYGPCILLVVISWVSFWLNREATSDRISLGGWGNLARLGRD